MKEDATGGGRGPVHFAGLVPPRRLYRDHLATESRVVVCFYNSRGMAEQWINEAKRAVKITRLSCHPFRSNQVRLWFSLIPYNLSNLSRRWYSRRPSPNF
jgi:Transposase DDE domain group 1